ncbi:hypothetical protein QUB47_30080 [Microcoleus sp. AT9_B5]
MSIEKRNCGECKPFLWQQPILGGKIMLGFQDFTSTNSYDYDYGWGYYYDPLMTTALLSDLNSPYSYGTNTYGSYGTIAGATPVSNANSANSDIAVVDSLLAEAWEIFQGAGTSAPAPVSSYPSPNTATVGSVGVGHQTGDPEVDSLLNLSDQVIADDKSWLDSLPKDPLTGMPVSSQSTLDPEAQSVLGEAQALLAGGAPLLNSTNSVGVGHKTGDPLVDSLLNLSDQVIADDKSWLDSLPKDRLTGMPVSSQSTLDPEVKSVLGEAQALLAGGAPLLNSTGNGASISPFINSIYRDASTVVNPLTTDAERDKITQKHQIAGQREGNLAMKGEMDNSRTKSEQRQNEYKFRSMGDVFNHEQIPGPDGDPIGHRIGDDVSLY